MIGTARLHNTSTQKKKKKERGSSDAAEEYRRVRKDRSTMVSPSGSGDNSKQKIRNFFVRKSKISLYVKDFPDRSLQDLRGPVGTAAIVLRYCYGGAASVLRYDRRGNVSAALESRYIQNNNNLRRIHSKPAWKKYTKSKYGKVLTS